MSGTIFKRDDANATLIVERVFSAARERVWRAMTEPQILDQWWAPHPWKTTTVTMDFRVGGFWHYSMSGPEGEQHFGRMDFTAIEPGIRFEAEDVFCDATGAPVESLPRQTFETTLHEAGVATRAVTVVRYASVADLEKILAMGMQEGLTMAQDQLEALLTP